MPGAPLGPEYPLLSAPHTGVMRGGTAAGGPAASGSLPTLRTRAARDRGPGPTQRPTQASRQTPALCPLPARLLLAGLRPWETPAL